MGGVVRADRDRVDRGQPEGGAVDRLNRCGRLGVPQEDPGVELLPCRLARAAAEGAHAPHLRWFPLPHQGLGRFEDIGAHQETGPDHEDVGAGDVEVRERARVPARYAPPAAQSRACGVGQDLARPRQRLGAGACVLGVVEEHGMWFPSQVLRGPLDGGAQPVGGEGVFPGEVPDLGGDREVRQEVAGHRVQCLVGAMVEVVRGGVEARFTEAGGCFEYVTGVTRPV